MERTAMRWIALMCVAFSIDTPSGYADQAADEATIRKNAESYVAAYNNHDAKALAAMWSPDAVYLDPSTGAEAVGQEDIEKAFAETVAESKEAKLKVKVESVR